MKTVMISIQPNWVEKILNLWKTDEVRKTRPKCELPFKALIYCTKARKRQICSGCLDTVNDSLWKTDNNKVGLGDSFYWQYNVGSCSLLNGKVVGEFICDKIYTINNCGNKYIINDDEPLTNEVAKESCLDYHDIHNYLGNKTGYAWHISDLKIYDEPKELSEFKKPELPLGLRYEDDRITRPPQDWFYVQGE